MSGFRKGLVVGAIQIALVLSLGAKLLYDRATRPRVWALAGVYDPELPIRGRYLSERMQLPEDGFSYRQPEHNYSDWYINRQWAYLQVRGGQLVATPQGDGCGEWVYLHKNTDGTVVAYSEEPVLFFVTEFANIPSLQPGQEMWVEVTVPAQGPPRPIRIGIKTNGVLTPLKLN